MVIITRDETGDMRTASGREPDNRRGGWRVDLGCPDRAFVPEPAAWRGCWRRGGAISGKLSDIGINDDFLKDVGKSLDKGGAAIGVLIRKMTGDKVMERMEAFRSKGRVIQTSLSKDADQALRDLFEAVKPLGQPADQLGGGRK